MNPIRTFQIHRSKNVYIHFNAHVTSIIGNPNRGKVWVATEKTNIYIKKVIGMLWKGRLVVIGSMLIGEKTLGWRGRVCLSLLHRQTCYHCRYASVPYLLCTNISFLPSTPTEWNDIDVYWESLKLQTYMNPWRVEVNPNDISVGTQN